ncbi:MAG TPA: hypothetical protein VLX68_17590 [Chitinivibrionales bacterium]|nr:hypothetical protein [Chitinivibrionales bacterium]
MKRFYYLSSITIIVLFSLAFSAKDKPAEGVILKADYGAKQQWTYTISYTSQGNFRQKSANTAKSTEIKCLLVASKKDAKKLSLKADSVSIKSDIYKEDLQKEITEKLQKSDYSLSLANGFPSIDTSKEIPAGNYLEWDLYRQLAKLLPSLPAKPLKPGFTWERTDVFPMNSPRGRVSCEVYRNYTFNVLAGDSAMISWKFRYAGSGKADSSALSNVPVFGTGNGTAVLDVKNGSIITAEMNFTTPVAMVGDVSVVWHENAVIKLVDVK